MDYRDEEIVEGRKKQVSQLSKLNSILGVILIVFISLVIISILPPKHGRMKWKQANCNSNLRQIALAIDMYSQDTGRYPGVEWVASIEKYFGSESGNKNVQDTFWCLEDKTDDVEHRVSYGYSGLLVQLDGNGVKAELVRSPSEVGVVCDATPCRAYPDGGLLFGGGLHPRDQALEPGLRHSKGAIVGYADGHAKYFQGAFEKRDLGHGIARALLHVSAVGCIDNPVGGLNDFTVEDVSAAPVAVGGEFCTRSLLLAAAGAWKAKAKAPMTVLGFNGQSARVKRPANYLWGIADGKPPKGKSVAIARDSVLVIVAKGSKLPDLGWKRNDSYEQDYPAIRRLFAAGYVKDSVQVYTLSAMTGTRRFFTAKLGENGKPAKIGKGAIEVANDWEMVEKVSTDPYGIGYCSSLIADPDLITVLALKMPDGKVIYYPRESKKYRWVLPDEPTWPWTRTLYAEYGGAAWQADGSGIANVMLAPGGAGTASMREGPLFAGGLWAPE